MPAKSRLAVSGENPSITGSGDLPGYVSRGHTTGLDFNQLRVSNGALIGGPRNTGRWACLLVWESTETCSVLSSEKS